MDSTLVVIIVVGALAFTFLLVGLFVLGDELLDYIKNKMKLKKDKSSSEEVQGR